MSNKKLTTFLLFAYIPMIIIGLALHLTGIGGVTANSDAETKMISAAIRAGAMLVPLIGVVLTQKIHKEPLLKGLGISFKINRWWFIGWLLIPFISFAILGMSLLMPGSQFSTDNEFIQIGLQQMPEGTDPSMLLGITIISGLFSGLSINALFGFGEEIAWRGFLVKELKGKKFIIVSSIIGIIWGFWHFPIILNGHNYPDHPVAGIFMMVLMCTALTPIFIYFRVKSESVIVPAIMHGTFNAVIGISNIFVTPQNDLLIGGPGLAGIIVLLIVDICLFCYDHFISKENLFDKEM